MARRWTPSLYVVAFSQYLWQSLMALHFFIPGLRRLLLVPCTLAEQHALSDPHPHHCPRVLKQVQSRHPMELGSGRAPRGAH
jgi:hypothetical protein